MLSVFEEQCTSIIQVTEGWPKVGLERWGKELAMQGKNMGLSFKGKWETIF